MVVNFDFGDSIVWSCSCTCAKKFSTRWFKIHITALAQIYMEEVAFHETVDYFQNKIGLSAGRLSTFVNNKYICIIRIQNESASITIEAIHNVVYIKQKQQWAQNKENSIDSVGFLTLHQNRTVIRMTESGTIKSVFWIVS